MTNEKAKEILETMRLESAALDIAIRSIDAVERIEKEIWDLESVGDIATVTVHIKKIREKIEFDSSKPQYIETIWGVGYRFKV